MPVERRKKSTAIKRGGIDTTLFTILMTMLAFGLIMVFSASSPSAYYYRDDQYYFIKRQIIWAVAGFAVMLIVSNINYKIIKRWAGVFCAVSLFMMLLVPFIGVEINGAKRWLGVGSLTIQPSEIAKFALILYFAKRISEKPKNHLNSFVHGLLPYIVILGAFIGAMILQDHLSAAVVTFLALVIALMAGGANLGHISAMGIAGAAALVPFAFLESYRFQRLLAFVNPFEYKQDIGWQIVQGLYAIGSGGLFGRGLGQSRQKFLYVPEAHNDYIYAILCEELGLIGAIAVAVLFAAFMTRCVIIAVRAPDTFASITVFGIAALIGLQYLINVGVVTSWLPNTGMQLPFFSAGGSSLLFLMAAMGIVFNISRYTKKEDGYSREPALEKGARV